MTSSLTLLAGPDALRRIRERGLSADDIDILPGASGGPKWLVLAGLDRVLFGEVLQGRTRPLHLIGSSIGSWRLACLAQKDPVAALERFAEAYIAQRYPPKPPASLVSTTSQGILDVLLGEDGEAQVLNHPWARLHVLTTRCRGLTASDQPPLQLMGLALGALGNLVSRRTLGLQLERVIFHGAGDTSPFLGLSDLPSVHLPLTRENLRPALLASGSIPLVMSRVRIPGAGPGVYRAGSTSRCAGGGPVRSTSAGRCCSPRRPSTSRACRTARFRTGTTSSGCRTRIVSAPGGRWWTRDGGWATSSASCSPPGVWPSAFSRCERVAWTADFLTHPRV
jgi:hypothetical protein